MEPEVCKEKFAVKRQLIKNLQFFYACFIVVVLEKCYNNNIVRGHTLLQVSRRRMDFDTVLCKNRSRSFYECNNEDLRNPQRA